MKRDFNDWIQNFRESIADFNYYVDYDKVMDELNDYTDELNLMNTLCGSDDIKKNWNVLLNKHPEVVKIIPLLVAIRKNKVYCTDKKGSISYNFKNKTMTNEEYTYFMEHIGLFKLLSKITNVKDYFAGVLVGLDSNARKNRGGHLMENLIEDYIIAAGYKENETYYKEMYLSDIESSFNLDLSKISSDGDTEKRFDYVIKTDNCVYGIECNFYSAGGSKLNETARSYKMIAEEAKDIEGFKFVWFTDGKGWDSAKNNLKETFKVLDDIYCLKELEKSGINELLNIKK